VCSEEPIVVVAFLAARAANASANNLLRFSLAHISSHSNSVADAASPLSSPPPLARCVSRRHTPVVLRRPHGHVISTISSHSGRVGQTAFSGWHLTGQPCPHGRLRPHFCP